MRELFFGLLLCGFVAFVVTFATRALDGEAIVLIIVVLIVGINVIDLGEKNGRPWSL